MRVFYPPRVAARLKVLRIEGWDIGRDTAEPVTDLILYRNGVPLAAQQVVLTYLTSGGRPFASSHTLQSDATVETIADVRIRRPLTFGFDVQVGDRFILDTDQTGEIKQVSQDRGMIYASGAFDSGSP